jgi:LysM repeat protein
MHDDNHDEYGFWSDEPTRPLERLAARRKPAGPAPVAPTRRPRPVDPQVGRRQHGNTQQIPVVPSEPAAQGLRQSVGHVDPLLRRMGALAIAVALCVPVAMSLRSSGDGRAALQPEATTLSVGSTAEVAADPTVAAAVPSEPASGDASVAAAAPAAQPAVTDAGTEPTTAATTPATEATEPAAANTISSAPAVARQPVEAASVTTELVCDKDYEVVAGDYWILIADKVSVDLKEVLAANNATTDTPIYPGRTICLPDNASTPTTAAPAPATTDAPATTAAPKATTTTVKATSTTVKTTSTSTPAAAAPKASYSRAEVDAIIRQVWPDDLEDEAVRIATRESNLVPGVRNYCCFGLFQLYYNVHKVWLGQMGVTSAEQLYDPLINAYVAYAMYLKAGGWGPWRL